MCEPGLVHVLCGVSGPVLVRAQAGPARGADSDSSVLVIHTEPNFTSTLHRDISKRIGVLAPEDDTGAGQCTSTERV